MLWPLHGGSVTCVSQAAEAGVTLTTSETVFQVRPGVVLGSAGSWKNKNLFARRMERLLEGQQSL